MNSKDEPSKSASKAKRSSQKQKLTQSTAGVSRSLHGCALAKESSTSSEDGLQHRNVKPKYKSTNQPNESTKLPSNSSKHNNKPPPEDENLSEMTTSSYKAVVEDLTTRISTSDLEQETDLDVDILKDEREPIEIKEQETTMDNQINVQPTHIDPVIVYHDDEEINQALKTSSDDDEFFEDGAALTMDDSSDTTFVVYPLGCCEFDETDLVSASSTKAIQKHILRLANKPAQGETFCWGLDQSQPILMRLYEEYIQFTDLKTGTLLRSQPIHAIKIWAVDDDNNFAFVVEDINLNEDYNETVDYALLSAPSMMCYVFRSIDDDDMSCKVAAKLNQEINRYKEQMSYRTTKSTRMQQMIDPNQTAVDDQTDIEDSFDELEATNETTLHVKYIGKTSVPRPVGIDVLNLAIDKCLAEASKSQAARLAAERLDDSDCTDNYRIDSGLLDVKLHVSPSNVIVENELTGEIIVECRIRYLTFMGISRRDIRWCGFIMQNTTNKSFSAYCFECHPTAGYVCEALQASCTKMYDRVVKNHSRPETASFIPARHRIRDTLVKTLSRMKLNPIRS